MKQIYAGVLLCLLCIVGIRGESQINANFVGTPATLGCVPLNVSFSDISVPSPGANIINSSRQWIINGVVQPSTANPFPFTFTSPGLYTIELVICDDSPSCDTFTRVDYINAFGLPSPSLSVSPGVGCAPLSVNITDNSTPECGIMTSTTIFPNNGGPNLNGSGTVTYNTPGNYNIRIRLVNACGCIKDTTYNNIVRVNQVPNANFNAANRNSCTSPHTVNFSNTSSGGANSYLWDFGDGTTSTAANPSHTYTSGNYTVRLIATNTVTGCADTFLRSSYVNIDSVVAQFTSANPSVCDGAQVCFTNQSSPAGGTYSWNFGDGSPLVTTANPCHTYPGTGSYTVSMTYTIGGCSQTRTRTNYVVINPNPTASISTNDDTTTCVYPYTVNWINNSLPGLNYSWAFTNSNISNSTNFTPPPVIYNPNGGNATLTVTDANGCTGSESKSILITPPNARFSVNRNRGCAPRRIRFTSTSTILATDSIISYQWDFNGDGVFDQVGPLDTGSFVFNDTGCYTPSLIINTIGGCTDTIQYTDRICLGDTPVVDFSWDTDTSCFEELQVNFVSLSTPGDSCYWDFLDGSPIVAGCDVNHTFGDVGTYYPLLTACHYGCCDTATNGPVVINPPRAELIDSFTCQTPLTRYFRTTTTRANRFLWDFGDPNRTDDTSTSLTAQWTYDTSGCFVVTLTAFNDTFNCSHSITRNRCIYDPIATVSTNRTEVCRNNPITLTNTSANAAPGNNNNSRWDFDYQGGSPSYETSPFLRLRVQDYTYSDPGVYSIVMRNTTPNGCTDTVTMLDWITVHGSYARIASTATSGCLPFSVTFTDTSFAPISSIDSIVWDFGDGSPLSSDSIITHVYANPGVYTATLTVWDTFGCRSSQSRTITVQHPDVNIAATDTFVCQNQNITFSNTGTVVGPNYSWTFPQGVPNTSNLSNPVINYPDTGVFQVGLTITDNLGCQDSATQSIIVRNPIANFGGVSTRLDCPPVGVQFVDSSLNNVVSWFWSYDNNTVTSNLQNPFHTYNRPVIDTITLIVTTSTGCTDTVSRTAFEVGGPAVTVSSEVLDSCQPVRVAYYVQSIRVDTIRTITPGAGLGSFTWIPSCYGTPANPCLDTFFITYSQPGNYTIDFLLTDTAGCSRLEQVTLDTIRVDTPSANFSLSFGNICNGGTVSFTDLSSGGSGGYPITEFYWFFGDGDTSSQQNPTHTYNNAGSYTVLLAVLNSIGCWDTSSRVLIIPTDPVANIYSPDSNACLPGFVQFYDSSTADTSIIAWSWDFGSMGAGSNAQNPTYTYNLTGAYTVTLTVTDFLGCQGSDTAIINVYANPTITTLDDTSHCYQDSIQLLAIGGTSYVWTPSMGLSDSSISNPWVSVDTTTKFFVTGLDANNCTNTDSIVVTLDRVIADFNFDTVCLGDSTSFTDQSSSSTGSVNSWLWNFDDLGATSTNQNPAHTFSADSVFAVNLQVTDTRGCSHDTTLAVPISPKPLANFSPDRACFGDTVNFTDLSLANTGVLVSWDWDFGDGDTSDLSDPSHFYAAPGNYTVCLTVSNSSACAGTNDTCIVVAITNKPLANFQEDSTCLADSSSFTDLSQDLGGVGFAQWQWDFDTSGVVAGSSTLQNPSFRYPAAGQYSVRLTVTDSAGCFDDTILTTTILQTPTAQFIGDTSCLGDSSCPIDRSIAGDLPIQTWTWDIDTSTGISLSGQSVCYLFGTSGLRVASLIVSDSYGCSDTSFAEIRVEDLPVANFIADTVCALDTTDFFDVSTTSFGSIVTWNWQFGNGDSSTLQNPSNVYQLGGVFNTSLTVTTDLGCVGDTIISVRSWLLPTSSFTVDTTCIGDSTFFFDAGLNNGDASINSWNWDLDLNNPGTITSNSTDPVVLYSIVGGYNFSLTVTDTNGCQDDSVSIATVVGLPTANFTSDSACIQDSICLTDNSAINAAPLNSWIWQFDLTDTSSIVSAQNACYVYPDTGVYTISLIITDALGCSDDTINTVVVSSIPTASFVTDSVCLGDTTFFTDFSVSDFGTIQEHLWNFGNGDTSSLQNPSYVYDSAGIYNVRLQVRNPIGCPDDTIIQVVVFDIPTANFIVDTTCIGDSTNFIDQSTNLPWGNIVAWTWDLDTLNAGSPILSVQNPGTIYSAIGTYPVSLSVTDQHGCVGDTVINAVVVGLPTARFTSDSACINDSICIVDSSIANAAPLTNWLWQFDINDTSSILSGQTACYEYPDSGNYTIRLIVTDALGCQDDTTNAVIVSTIPTASFVTDSVCLGDTTFFTNFSVSDFGTITNYLWSFGNGDTSVLQDPFYVYDSAGIYNVRLTVVNSIGCPDDTVVQVVVFDIPEANFTADTVCFGDTTRFIDLSSNAPWGNIVGWQWDVDTLNPGSPTYTNQNPSHLYGTLGTYAVRLTATDEHGCVGDTVLNTSQFILPTAIFTSDTVCDGDSICLTDQSLAGTGLINNWNWDLGDASSSNQNSFCHLYADSGLYQVSLTVTDDRGCTDDTVRFNRVNLNPIALFTFLPTCSGDSTRFLDLSQAGQGIVDTWTWDFDDMTGSNDQNPIHIYAVGDTFRVTLTVGNEFGCFDSISRVLPILQGPIPDYVFDTVCFGDTTSFSDASSNGAGVNQSWFWDFGNGDTAVGQNVQYSFPLDQTYNVQLTVTDTNDCVARVTQDVIVFTLPTAAFTNSNLCFRSAINFTDQSVQGFNPITNWLWDFDDLGASSTLQNPQHTFTLPSTYDVSLVVTDSRSCVDTVVRSLTVNPKPIANFGIDRPFMCPGEQVCFTDSSTVAGSTGAISGWNWDFNFNTGTDATTQNPCTIYPGPGTYSVQLIVSDTNQCTDTLIQLANVYNNPSANFDWQVACVDSPMQFTDFSLEGDTAISDWLWDFGDFVQDIVQNPTHEYQTPGNFNVTLTVTDEIGCTDSESRIVQVDFRPDIQAQGSQTICWGESVVLSATGATTYTWEDNIWYNVLTPSGDSILATPLGTITYTVTGENGVCPPDDTTVTVTVIPTRPMTLDVLGPDSVVIGTGTQLFADISGIIDSISWTPDASLSCNDCRDPFASPDVTTTYTATIYYSENGVVCTQTDVITVYVVDQCPEDLLYVPSGFSPNQDGNNDRLYVRGVGIQTVNFFRVFDRWGNLVFESLNTDANDASVGWDGTDNGGKRYNPGVFVYVTEVVCSNGNVLTKTGNVTLIK